MRSLRSIDETTMRALAEEAIPNETRRKIYLMRQYGDEREQTPLSFNRIAQRLSMKPQLVRHSYLVSVNEMLPVIDEYHYRMKTVEVKIQEPAESEITCKITYEQNGDVTTQDDSMLAYTVLGKIPKGLF